MKAADIFNAAEVELGHAIRDAVERFNDVTGGRVTAIAPVYGWDSTSMKWVECVVVMKLEHLPPENRQQSTGTDE